jgi:mRNA interferase MazF
MKQGEIWYADLNPATGSEQTGFRPILIVSGNMLNEHLKVVIAMPITTKIKNYKGNLVLQPDAQNGLTQESEVLSFHIRSISKERLKRRIGKISKRDLQELIESLNDILRY